MADIRLQRMAKVLVHYSLAIKKGDRLGIMTGPNATPLVREVVREVSLVEHIQRHLLIFPGYEKSC